MTATKEITSASGVGAPVLDRQHDSIFGYMDHLYGKMNNGCDFTGADELFNDLLQYMRAHKRDEEELLKCMGYPEIKEHREHHAVLLAELRNVGELISDRSANAQEMLWALRERFRDHIEEEDQKFASYLHDLHSTVIF